jgi:hypothetical protein
MNIRLLNHAFQVMASWQLKEIFTVSALSFHANTAGDRLLGPFFLPSCLTRAASRAVARCGSADLESFMVQAWLCSTTISSCSSGILEQQVSRTTERMRWTNSMACSLPGFKFLKFLSLGISEVYCLCYRSHNIQNLQRQIQNAFEMVCMTWNFPTIRTITVWTYNILHWSSRLTLWAFSLVFRMPQLGNHASEGLCS